jgi:phosphatidylinositol kinase/protein kinase (PI-3  family)
MFWSHLHGAVVLHRYRVVATGDKSGIIEAVPHVTTIGKIQGGVSGALKKTVLTDWLVANKPARVTWPDLVKNFVRSLAGSCVFEFLLGLGDRHGDNIMYDRTHPHSAHCLTGCYIRFLTDGTIFHIDFAYIMGHKTTFVGIRREIQPFTLVRAGGEVVPCCLTPFRSSDACHAGCDGWR